MADSALLTSLVAALVAAFVGGFIASHLRLPPIVGYLLAGLAVGPYTPGGSADATVASELAEVGVILLMFGVGLHFSLRDLMAVRSTALVGAVGQIAVATALGFLLAQGWGWRSGEGVVLGLAIAVASTVVLLRSLEDRGRLDSTDGHVAIGWLIVEDLFTVLVLVLLPALAVSLGGSAGEGLATAAGGDRVLLTLAIALGKAALFVVLMLYGGRRLAPWLLTRVARGGSGELFTLGVLAVALGVAYVSAELFGVSLALGAFLAGVVLGESDLSHRAAADALPMRDAFAVLFFVSVGMLFDPAVLVEQPGRVAALLAVVVVGKAVTAFLVVALLGRPARIGLTVAAGLAQIGEFTFILISVGATLDLFPAEGRSLVLAAALLSITLNPLLFRGADWLDQWLQRRPTAIAWLKRTDPRVALRTEATEHLQDHVVLCGYGRAGRVIGAAIVEQGWPYLVIEQDHRLATDLRERGVPTLYGNAGATAVLTHASLERARLLVSAIPDPVATRLLVHEARRRQPALPIIARAYSEDEAAELQALGATLAVVAERELALEIVQQTLLRSGVSPSETLALVERARARPAPLTVEPARREQTA